MPALNHFGLDIGTHSIKAVQFSGSTDRPVFVTAGQVKTPLKSQNVSSDKQISEVASAIKSLYKEAHISTNKVITALPESQIFTRVVEMPNLSQEELKKAISWE